MNPSIRDLVRRAARIAPVALLTAALLVPSADAQTTAAATQSPLTPSQVPLSLSPPLPPNLFLTIDDSGSMAWGHVPDTLYQNSTNNTTTPGTAETLAAGQASGGTGAGACSNLACGAARGYKSAALNPLYYDPTVAYVVPPDANGNLLTTSYTAAYLDGFNPTTSGAIDLSSQYRPTSTYFPGSTLAAPWAPGSNQAGLCPNSSNFLCNDWAQHNVKDLGAFNPKITTSAQPTGAYYYTYVASNGGCTQSLYDDNCYTLVNVSATSGPNATDERQNFAIWYSFYRTRHLALVTSAARAMADASLSNAKTPARVAWQAIDTCNQGFTTDPVECGGWAGPGVSNAIQAFTGTHKADFYTFLKYLPAAGGTPMRSALDRVGQYIKNTGGPDGPWGNSPNQPAATQVQGPELSCRRNFHIMLTDGEWNQANSTEANYPFCGNAAGCGNASTTPITLPDGAQFGTGGNYAVYNDPNSTTPANQTTLADLAFYYWSHDLNPDNLASNLRSLAPAGQYWNPQYDPASWHHLVNFTVGLGLDKFMTAPPAWAGGTYAGPGYAALVAGTQNWPMITVGDTTPSTVFPGFNGTDDPAKVYDLWHAAINSRGQAFSASTPQGLMAAFNAFINQANFAATGATAVAANSTSLQTNTDLFQASYVSADWHGTIQAFPLVFNGTTANGASYTVNMSTIDWTTDSSVNAGAFPAPTSRNVYTMTAPTNPPMVNGMATATPGVPGTPIALTQNNLTGAGLWTGTYINDPNVLAWLLGDQTNEQSKGGTLRSRPVSILGDIVDSDPTYAFGDDFGYSSLSPALGGGIAYANYVAAKKKANQPMLYVGANDGMLHGFLLNQDATTGKLKGGTERMAYMPIGVLSKVAQLASTNYTHQFYVDAAPFVADAYLNNAWTTMLVGLTGAGGKSAFAIDVSSPTSFGAGAPGSNATNIKWEIDATTPDGQTLLDADLGFTIGQAIIAPLNDGKWYAIFGNGYASARGCAVLYLVELANGTVHKIDTSTGGAAGTANCPAANGLGSPALLDINGDRIVDYAYAGDQQGNMWKFDLTAVTSANWKVPSNAGTVVPLFTAMAPNAANTPQPISAAPQLGPAPAGRAGVMVYFGTGRFFITSDPADTTTESFYGILDPGAGTPQTAAITRTNLVQQTITEHFTNNIETSRSVSSNPMSLQQKGWYLDLPDPGERVLGTPLVLDGDVFFSTVVPGTTDCLGGGTSFIMAVGAQTGAGGNTGGNSQPPAFLTASGSADGVLLSGLGAVRSLGSISDPANSNDVVLAGGSGGIDAFAIAHAVGRIRTSWQELVQ